MIEPKVYIIILNWNGLSDTVECLESLKKITYKNYKVIVVDNASKNDEINVLKKLFANNVHYIQNNCNNGFSAGNNLGIKFALLHDADYILLLNNDTTVESNFLTELVKTAENNESNGIVTPKIVTYNDHKKIWFAGGKIYWLTGDAGHVGYNEIDNEKHNVITNTDFASGCCLLISKKVFDKIGFFDEKYFLYYEDTDFSFRSKNSGFKIIYNPKAVIYHKEISATDSFSKTKSYYLTRNKLYFIQKNFPFYVKSYLGITLPIYWIKTFVNNFLNKKNNLNKYFLIGLKDFILKKQGKFKE